VAATDPSDDEATGRPLRGSLPDLPELDWEDFQRGSELVRRDVERDEDVRPA
jgi:hypothetical protein